MAKEPEPGNVKTRLCPPLTPVQAADLYEAFFLDTVSLISGIQQTDVFVAYDPHTALNYFSRILPETVKCIPQGRGDLGNRLSGISSIMFSQGYRKVIMLASDAPHLPQDRIRLAINSLDDTDVILGPCDDGGYYLIGLRYPSPEVFEGIPWSTSRVLDLTIQRSRETGKTCELLPPCYDIDTWQDVKRLMRDMQVQTPNDMNRCPRTKKVLAGLTPVLPG
jgi:hypothetical protein